VPVVHDVRNALFADFPFTVLLHLTSIGLVELSASGYGLREHLVEVAPSYCGKVHRLKSDGGKNRHFPFGRVIYTGVCRELFRICDAEGNEPFRAGILEYWKSNGWGEVSSQEQTADTFQATTPLASPPNA